MSVQQVINVGVKNLAYSTYNIPLSPKDIVIFNTKLPSSFFSENIDHFEASFFSGHINDKDTQYWFAPRDKVYKQNLVTFDNDAKIIKTQLDLDKSNEISDQTKKIIFNNYYIYTVYAILKDPYTNKVDDTTILIVDSFIFNWTTNYPFTYNNSGPAKPNSLTSFDISSNNVHGDVKKYVAKIYDVNGNHHRTYTNDYESSLLGSENSVSFKNVIAPYSKGLYSGKLYMYNSKLLDDNSILNTQKFIEVDLGTLFQMNVTTPYMNIVENKFDNQAIEKSLLDIQSNNQILLKSIQRLEDILDKNN